ncbi:MAG: enoyl-CoA hydratase/isomerase family protein, partial [Gemmatimonadetes bacterium]|nr:enoyl-CoA hydratase/isomerase family protein [Gemmatimonadota bacterium]
MSHIVTTTSGRVLEVEIQRRDKKNALTSDMYAAMSDALLAADADPSVHAVYLHGQSDLFSSGNDVADFLDPAARARGEAQRFVRTIATTRTPIVAAVGGIAIGVGATMLLHCDLVIAADGARLQFPFVSLGLCPEAGASLLLPALVGDRRAAAILLLGDPVDATQARDLGIVNDVVPEAALIERGRALAARLAAQPRDALFTTKALLRRPTAPALEDQMNVELQEFARLLDGDA